MLISIFTAALIAPLWAQNTGKVQFIHASADVKAAECSLYFGDTLLTDHFAFRQATAALEVPADEFIAFEVTDNQGGFPYRSRVNVQAGKQLTLVLTGLQSEIDYLHNPEGWYTFFLFRLPFPDDVPAVSPQTLNVRIFNSVTDAPRMDFMVRDAGLMADSVHYGLFSEFITVPPEIYLIDVLNTDDHSIVYGSFRVDLTGAAGQTVLISADGFLYPEKNQNGAPLALTTVFPNGTTTVAQSSSATGIGEVVPQALSLRAYPTPASSAVTVDYTLEQSAATSLVLFDALGREVLSLRFGAVDAGPHAATLDVASLPAGIYTLVMQSGSSISTTKVVKR